MITRRQGITFLALSLFFAIAGCVQFPDRIDTRLDSPEAENQLYEPAIVIISGVHLMKTSDKKEEPVGLGMRFRSTTPITQVEGGETIKRTWFNVWVSGSLQKDFKHSGSKVLALPPGKYKLANLFAATGGYDYFEISVNQTHEVPGTKTSDDVAAFEVKPGEVLNLGFIQSSYSRKDKAWLDIKVERNEAAAQKALAEKFDTPGPYIAKIKTRLLNVPSKLW